MVKQIFSFIKWQIRRWNFEDYLWSLGFVLLSVGFIVDQRIAIVGSFIICGILFKMLVCGQWDKWKEERKQLLETIKDSK